MPSIEADNVVHVAVGVLRRGNGDILIARRHANAHQGGLWEFPGGKKEQGESILSALAREFQEELGVDIATEACRPLTTIRHQYPDKSVYLDVWWIDRFEGEPEGREGQPLKWVAPSALEGFAFPDANKPILQAICSAK